MKNNMDFRISKIKIIYMPVLVAIICFLILAVISNHFSYRSLRNQVENSSQEIVELLSKKIQLRLEGSNLEMDYITTSLFNAGEVIINHNDIVSNDYLKGIAESFKIDHIYYYDPNGELIYSSDETYIGWTPKEGDPIDSFMKNNQNRFEEDVRKGTETDDYYKFVYLKSEDGYFVQLGHCLETIEYLLPENTIQSTLERTIHEDKYMVYALATDKDLIAIADTDHDDIGIDYKNDPDYSKALAGESVIFEWYYEKLDETVIEVATPLLVNNEIAGIVTIGISQSQLRSNALFLAMLIFFTTILIIVFNIWIQNNNVIKPIIRLNNDIEILDINKPEKSLIYNKNNVFYGLYESVNALLKRIESSQKNIEHLNEEILELAYKDYLTKLPNRYAFKEEFNQLIENNKKVAVVVLDLDNFKEYNDARGHSFGDLILIEIGKFINQLASKNFIVSRYGGDEFMLAIAYENEEDLMTSIERVEDLFKEEFLIGDESIILEGSIGISLAPNDGKDLDELTPKADLAMYSVKENERSRVAFYSEKMRDDKFKYTEINKYLKEAIKNDGFKLLYQPIIDLKSNKAKCYEVLLRFKNRNIFPDEFIPIAEKTGLIIPMGRYVIENAIKEIAKWKNEYKKDFSVSINFSSRQFYDLEVIDFIKEKLEFYNVSGSLLKIEITETFMLGKNIDETNAFFYELKALGIEIALDDFGAGFTSVLFFNNFPFDIIKLDRLFLSELLLEPEVNILRQWMALFEGYGYQVIAEGVETKDQLILLKDVGVDFVQGYYFSKPVSVEEIQKFNVWGD